MASAEIYTSPMDRIRSMEPPVEAPPPVDWFDEVLWSNIAAGVAVALYLFVLWLGWRGYWQPRPRTLKLLRWAAFAALALPIAARYHYSQEAILYLSAAMLMVAGLMKLKQKLGI